MREKIGAALAGVGFMAIFVFGAALDGPENDMRVVYGGIIAGMIIFTAGAITAEAWN